jgi:hypothetical protein
LVFWGRVTRVVADQVVYQFSLEAMLAVAVLVQEFS